MIRYKSTVNVEPLEQLDAFLDQFEDVAFGEWQDAVSANEANILDELQTEPRPAVHPIEWASDAQRIAVMAKLTKMKKEGKNDIPYQRTHELANAWVVKVERSEGNFYMVIQNPASIAKFVYGSLAQNRTQALRFQQPFHKNTGWQAATDTAQFWLDAVIEDYRNRMLRIGTVVFSGRAYTKGKPYKK